MSSRRAETLDAFLGQIGDRGYAAVGLRDVAQAVGLGMAELYGLFPDKVALAGAFMARIDAEVLAGAGPSTDPEETPRDRLFDTMMRRYDALKPYRSAVRALRQAAVADPLLGLALGAPLRRSMACILEAASITSDGTSGAVRQMGLLAVDQALLGIFMKDDSADLSQTMAALDRRLKTAERWIQVIDKYI